MVRLLLVSTMFFSVLGLSDQALAVTVNQHADQVGGFIFTERPLQTPEQFAQYTSPKNYHRVLFNKVTDTAVTLLTHLPVTARIRINYALNNLPVQQSAAWLADFTDVFMPGNRGLL